MPHRIAPATADEKYQQMTCAPVAPLIVSLAIPTIVSNLVSTIYNLADAFFIGQISTSASGAIGVAYATMTAIQAVGFFFGQGAGNAISRELGRQEVAKTGRIASVAVASSFLGGIVIAVLGLLLLEPICTICGATETIMPYATTYIGIILIGAPWMCTSLVLNNLLRFEGSATFAMVGLVSGAVLNFALAPALIFWADLGIAGAGLATIICQLVSFVILTAGLSRGGAIRLSFHDARPSVGLYRTIASSGIPSLARQVVLGVATICMNTAARPFGDAAIAAIAVVNRVTGIGNCVQIGIGQGFQPVCGYNYGARLYKRVRAGYFFSVKASLVILAAFCAVVFVVAPQIVGILRNDPEVIAIGTATLRFQCVSLPLTGLAMITNFMLQTTGKTWRASFLGMARLGIILAPTVMVMSALLGLLGVELAQSVSDLITLGISIPMAASLLHELARREAQGEIEG